MRGPPAWMNGAILGAVVGMLALLLRLAGNVVVQTTGLVEGPPIGFWQLLPGYLVSVAYCVALGGVGGLVAGLWSGSRLADRPPWLAWTVYGTTFGAVSAGVSFSLSLLWAPEVLREVFARQAVCSLAAAAAAGCCLGLTLKSLKQPVVCGALAGVVYGVVYNLLLGAASGGQTSIFSVGMLPYPLAGAITAAWAPRIVQRLTEKELQTAEA